MPKTVISNTSPLQYLFQADSLEVLKMLYAKVAIPEAVRDEIVEGRKRSVHLRELESFPWTHVREASARKFLPLATDLGPGEREAIALALETKDSLLLMDDALARRHALHLGSK